MRSKDESTINAIIEYINGYFFDNQTMPSVQMIADHIGIAKGTVSKYLTYMESKGLITKSNPNYSFSTKLIDKRMVNIYEVPVVGEIACGTPILAEENIESFLTISGSFLGKGKFFVLVAKGDSMINAGIDNGDYVVVRQQNCADEGQIVVALVDDGECTLKRYYKDEKLKKVRLHPENDEMEDMHFDTISIQGVAVKVIKNLED